MTCRCCGSPNVKLVIDLGAQAWGNDFIPIRENRTSQTYPLELCICTKCSMLQLGYTVPKEVMFIDHAYLSGTTKSLKKHFEQVGEETIQRIPLGASDLVFDIGGNDGTFLQFFKDRGIRCLNIDSGKLQAAKCRENGIECVNDFFNEDSASRIRAEYGQATVIHGSGILFHLEELHSAFKGIRDMLNPDGMLVAEFIYLPEMIRNCAYDQIYHEHLLYYSLQSFSRLLEQFDLEVHDAFLKPIHGGSCVSFISHRGRRKKTPGLIQLLKMEDEDKLSSIDTYVKFAERVRDAKSELVSIIRNLRKLGNRIQALGAPVKGSTLINYCGLTEDDLECAVEINPHKCETYYPGTRIPVFHQDQVKEPDAYLLLSWNFKDEILGKLTDYRKNGGKIIVPIPSPHIE